MREKEPFSLLLIIFIISLFMCYHLYYFVENKVNKKDVENYVETSSQIENNPQNVVEKIKSEEKIESYIGVLSIPKINVYNGFYEIDSPNNDVNKNIQVLKGSDMPNITYGTFMLAAHSGTSYISYFKDLNKLSLNDEVYVYYANTKYTYFVQKMYEIARDGTISFDKNIHETYLVLTTCGNEGKQLIVIAKRKGDIINE